MSENNQLPDDVTREAFTIFDLVTRFAALLEVYGAESLALAASWLQGAIREAQNAGADGVRDAYILTTAVDVLRDAASVDANHKTLIERTPQAELATLRVSIARLAQSAGVETRSLPLLSPEFLDFGKLASLARSNERGWNALVAFTESTIQRRESEHKAALAVAVEGVKMLVENGDVEEAHEQMMALAPFFTNADGTGYGDYFKAIEQIEIGEPYTLGVHYLENLVAHLKARD